jgi:hypothetical protein
MSIKIIFFVAALFFFATQVHAQSAVTTKSFHLGLGLLDHDAGVAADSATSGSKPFFGQLYSQLTLMGFFPVANQWSVSPIFSISIFSKKSPEGNEKTSVTLLGFRFNKPFEQNFDFHLGSGLIAYQIKGSGGTVSQNNGNGTATFGTPGDSKASSQVYYDLGVGYALQKYKFDLSLLVTEIFDSSKLAFNPMFTFTAEIFR